MEEMKELVQRITAEVLKRLCLPEEPGDALAVFTGPVFSAEHVKRYLKSNYSAAECALLEGARFESSHKAENIVTLQEKEALAARLNSFEKIVIVTPPLWLLSAISKGDDSVYPAMLALRQLLWGRDVTVLLDFEAPKARRSEAFARIAAEISSIEEMGAKLAYLPQECKKDEPKELVTEQDVKDACRNECRLIKIKPGAIITQLAEDTAKEMGVTIGM